MPKDDEPETDLYLPEDGGLVLGPDGEPAGGRGEDAGEGERPTAREDWPDARCDYCGRTTPKRKQVNPTTKAVRWLPPVDEDERKWRELPNGLMECPRCRPVKDVETGRMVRPDPDARG